MKSGQALRRKKTNLAPALAGAYTMNAPGVYPVPYGATGVMVGGRGARGNSGSGGNYAGGGNLNSLMYGYSYTDFWDPGNSIHVYSVGDDPWGPSDSAPSTRYYSANYNTPWSPNQGGYYPGWSVVYYSVSGYSPGYYNPEYYNPYYPGYAGTPATIGGVTLPGGPAGSPGAIVSPALSTLNYQTAGISVTVPSGGYVVLTPIGK